MPGHIQLSNVSSSWGDIYKEEISRWIKLPSLLCIWFWARASTHSLPSPLPISNSFHPLASTSLDSLPDGIRQTCIPWGSHTWSFCHLQHGSLNKSVPEYNETKRPWVHWLDSAYTLLLYQASPTHPPGQSFSLVKNGTLQYGCMEVRVDVMSPGCAENSISQIIAWQKERHWT